MELTARITARLPLAELDRLVALYGPSPAGIDPYDGDAFGDAIYADLPAAIGLDTEQCERFFDSLESIEPDYEGIMSNATNWDEAATLLLRLVIDAYPV